MRWVGGRFSCLDYRRGSEVQGIRDFRIVLVDLREILVSEWYFEFIFVRLEIIVFGDGSW